MVYTIYFVSANNPAVNGFINSLGLVSELPTLTFETEEAAKVYIEANDLEAKHNGGFLIEPADYMAILESLEGLF